MRATYLQFRSPKEQTAGYLNVNVTSDGRSLKYKAKEQMKTTFSKGQRWEHIKEVARRTSYKVGPGCYNFPITTNKGKGPVIIKDQVLENPSNGNFDYIYVGDTLMKRERPTTRGGLSPREFLYTSERNLSPVGSRFRDGEISGRNSMRAMSAGRNSAPRMDHQTGEDSPYSSARRIYPSYTYQQNGGNSPSVQPKKKMPSYDYPIMRNTSHSPTRQYERQNSGGQQSPSRYTGNTSPGRRSNNNSARNLHDDERGPKDFYANLQDQWNNNNQKIVIHRQGSGKRIGEDSGL